MIKHEVETKPDSQLTRFFNKFFKDIKTIPALFSAVGLINGK